MVNIKKGKQRLSIPIGSLKKYTSTGWEIDDNTDSSYASSKDPVVLHQANPEPDGDNGSDLENNEDEDDSEEFEYVDPEDLAKKPLDELDIEDLKILAEYKGIDISDLRTAKKLRAAIEALE